MTIALAIAFNAVLMVALVGTLVTVMSRAARLRPHVSATADVASQPVVLRQPARPRVTRRPEMALADIRG